MNNSVKQASILIKPASANCNMDCRYCFYKCLSSNREQYNLGFMSDEVLDNLIKNAIEYADEYLTFAFQGGEPTLVGIDFFRKVVRLQKQYAALKPSLRIDNTIQTNGVTLNDEWCEFFHQENFLVGVSLDGPRKNHDLARIMADGKESFAKVMQGIELLKKYNVDFNILTVVTEQLSEKASALYRFYKRNGFNYVQLIPCMDEEKRQLCLSDDDKKESTFINIDKKQSASYITDVDKRENTYINAATKQYELDVTGDENKDVTYAIKPESYGRFLNEFFDMWYEDFKRGDIMDVRMFSNLAQMTVGYPPEECGMCGKCDAYFVVEGDGSVYPCDFYCMDEYRLGTVKDSFINLKNSENVKEFESTSVIKPEKCRKCEYYDLCRGGCRRFRETGINKDGVNYLCEGYKLFFGHTKERFIRLGQTIINPAARRNL